MAKFRNITGKTLTLSKYGATITLAPNQMVEDEFFRRYVGHGIQEVKEKVQEAKVVSKPVVVDTPKVEEAKVLVDTPKVEEQVVVDTPKVDETTTVVDTPKVEEAKVTEAPKRRTRRSDGTTSENVG